MSCSNRLTRSQFLHASAIVAAAATLVLPARAEPAERSLPWQVGTGIAEITPPLQVGILMSTGRRAWQPFESVRMPLHARAVVIEKADCRIAIVALDLLGLGDEAVGGMRQFKEQVAAHAAGALKADDIVLCSSHTHSGPASLGCTDLIHTEDFKKWVQDLARKIGSALKDAAGAMRPCRLAAGSSSAPGHAVNRRIKTTKGIRSYRVTMPPEIVIGPEGPTDESVNIAVFLDRSGQPVALLVNATAHPIHEMVLPKISPDYPGEMCAELDRRHPGSMALFLNGAAGNVNPPLVSGGPEDSRKHGLQLAEVVEKALGDLRPVEGDELALRWRLLKLPARDAKGEPLDEPLETRIAAIRMGKAVWCFLPGEPFIETSLAIRKASPWDFTVVVGYAEEWIGYIPTDRAYENGGYEVRSGSWAKVARGAETIFWQEAIELVGRLEDTR